MLIRFAVENFLCFAERASLELGSPSESPSPTSITLLCGDTASGKSSLQKALACVRNLVLSSSRPGQPLPITPSAFAPTRPSCFELSLRHDDVVWTYRFSATTRRIEEESLAQDTGNGPRTLYTRRAEGSTPVNIELGDIAAADRQRLELVAYGTRPEQLFLNEALRRGVSAFAPVGIWLRDRLQLVLSETKVVGLASRAAREPAFAEFLEQLLESAQTGVLKVEARREPLPDNTFESEDEERELITALTSFPDAFAETPDGELIAERDGRLVDLFRVRLVCTIAGPNGQRAELPVSALSDGTQRLLHLAPILHTRINGPVFFVDDLDRGMSPRLASGLLQRFIERGAAAGQLIATVRDAAPFLELSPSPRVHELARNDQKPR